MEKKGGLYGDDRGISKVQVLHFSSKAPERESLAKRHNTSFMEVRALQAVPVNESRKEKPRDPSHTAQLVSKPAILKACAMGFPAPRMPAMKLAGSPTYSYPRHLSMVWPALDLTRRPGDQTGSHGECLPANVSALVLLPVVLLFSPGRDPRCSCWPQDGGGKAY